VRVGRRELVAGAEGVDEVELRLVAHAGASPQPLHKGASGGELSRVMLALEVALAGADPVPTMVFDEVDAGVGGRAAVEIGRRLARLASRHQVIVVTHLPQVAAYADRHLVVDKSRRDGGKARSRVRTLARTSGSSSWPACWPGWTTPTRAAPTPKNSSKPPAPTAPPTAPPPAAASPSTLPRRVPVLKTPSPRFHDGGSAFPTALSPRSRHGGRARHPRRTRLASRATAHDRPTRRRDARLTVATRESPS
jgi:energy-coupling factor transporter ATP-binding protein EcfA2